MYRWGGVAGLDGGHTPKWAGKVRCICEAIKFLFLFLWTFGSAECMVSLNSVYREGRKCQ